MFGNKQAGLTDVVARLGRRHAKPERAEPFVIMPHKEPRVVVPTQMYFAVAVPIRGLR